MSVVPVIDSSQVDVAQSTHGSRGPAVIELAGVRKRFGSLEVLQGLDLAVHPGEVFGFLGRNGAGKSTAIRILMGITRADAGSVRLFGENLSHDLIGIRQRIGYVAQDQNMYPWMSPRALSRFVRGFYPRWDQSRFEQLNDSFQLPEKRRIGTFSGGMKAKLALSVAVSTRPDLLILDEPTAGMDPVARREFLDLVREQTERDGATTFFSTHLIDEIEAIASRIAIVESGRTLYEGALAPLRDSLASWSIDARDWVPGSLPGEFARERLRIVHEGVRAGRHVLTLQFEGTAPVVTTRSAEAALGPASVPSPARAVAPSLAPGWRAEPMSLEDVFIAVVAGSNPSRGHA